MWESNFGTEQSRIDVALPQVVGALVELGGPNGLSRLNPYRWAFAKPILSFCTSAKECLCHRAKGLLPGGTHKPSTSSILTVPECSERLLAQFAVSDHQLTIFEGNTGKEN